PTRRVGSNAANIGAAIWLGTDFNGSLPWPTHASSPMTTMRVPPLTVRSRDRTGLVTTTPLYCSTPLTVMEIRYESTFSRPFVIALTSKDGMAIGNEASGDSPVACDGSVPIEGAGAEVAPLVAPDAVGAPDPAPPQAANTRASGMSSAPARPAVVMRV